VDNTCERTNRAVYVQYSRLITSTIFHIPRPHTEMMTIIKGRSGITIKKSVKRISPFPIRPPK